MSDVRAFGRRIDTHDGIEAKLDAVGAASRHADDARIRQDGLADAEIDRFDIEFLAAVETERIGPFPFFELQRNDAHPDQIGPMDALEALGENRFDA